MTFSEIQMRPLQASTPDLARQLMHHKVQHKQSWASKLIQPGSVRAAELATCPRKLWLHHKGVQPTNAASAEDMQKHYEGDVHEAMVLHDLRGLGHRIGHQNEVVRRELAPGLVAKGRANGILVDLAMVLEIKAISDQLPERPHTSHYDQANLFALTHPRGLQGMLIHYKSRATGKHVDFWLEPDPERLEALTEHAVKVVSGDLPNADPLPECGRCRYRSLCFDQAPMVTADELEKRLERKPYLPEGIV